MAPVGYWPCLNAALVKPDVFKYQNERSCWHHLLFSVAFLLPLCFAALSIICPPVCFFVSFLTKYSTGITDLLQAMVSYSRVLGRVVRVYL